MLGNRKAVFAVGLSIPAANPCQPMRNIFNFNIQWRWVQNIKAPATQHPLPCARRDFIFCRFEYALTRLWFALAG
jgi:hypothetical protein